MKKGLFVLLCFFCMAPAFAQVVMVGPMLHLNFEGKKVKPSFAVEASCWWLKGIPYGVDAGFEFQKGKFRLYSEAQTGIGIAGLSAGPFVEFAKATPVKAGLQLTGWMNYYIGADLRVRIYRGPDVFAAGLYGKLPLFVEGNNEENESEWWDWDDWD